MTGIGTSWAWSKEFLALLSCLYSGRDYVAKKGKHGVLSKSAQGFPTSIYVVVKLLKKSRLWGPKTNLLYNMF
jgi:hypothetical protein